MKKYSIKIDSPEAAKKLLDWLPAELKSFYKDLPQRAQNGFNYFQYPAFAHEEFSIGNHLSSICYYSEISVDDFLKMKQDKKIIGYKCPMDLFGGYVKSGTIFYPEHKDTRSYAPIAHGLGNNIPKEIVETWEPVYEEELKVGDFIYFLNSFDKHVPGDVVKITKLQPDINNSTWIAYDSGGFRWNFNGFILNKDFRKATPEEIEKTQIKTFSMTASNGNFILEVSKKGIYYPPEESWLNTKHDWTISIQQILDVTTSKSVTGYKVGVSKVDVGCKKDTLVSEWKEVYKYYKSAQ